MGTAITEYTRLKLCTSQFSSDMAITSPKCIPVYLLVESNTKTTQALCLVNWSLLAVLTDFSVW